jgi:hypothetical protein
MVAVVPSEEERAAVTETTRRRFPAWDAGLVMGTTDELIQHFRALHDRGVERFYVWFADFARPTTLMRFGDVITALGRQRR